MSLLDDVFLQDEEGEAQELERVIDGDEYDERPRSPNSDSDNNSVKDDEADEDKRHVDPSKTKSKHVVRNPRFILNPARLTGPRGIQVIPDHFKHFQFKGKGHEKDDLDLILKKLEHWAYRLYPKFAFQDCLKKIETLGKKRPVMVHLHKIRSGQTTLECDEAVVQNDSTDNETTQPVEEDEFDKLLQQQIELAQTTPASSSAAKGFMTPSVDKRSPLMMPKATSSPSISDEQKERMIRNRRLAEERRLARQKQNAICNNYVIDNNDFDKVASQNDLVTLENVNSYAENGTENNDANKRSKSHSDEEPGTMSVNEPVAVVDIRKLPRKPNVMESSDEENGIEKKIVDVQDTISYRIIDKSKCNITNSSDEECEMAAVNTSVMVDVHSSVTQSDINAIPNTRSNVTTNNSDDISKYVDEVIGVEEHTAAIAKRSSRNDLTCKSVSKGDNEEIIKTRLHQVTNEEQLCVKENIDLKIKDHAVDDEVDKEEIIGNQSIPQEPNQIDNEYHKENVADTLCDNNQCKTNVDLDVMDVDFSEDF